MQAFARMRKGRWSLMKRNKNTVFVKSDKKEKVHKKVLNFFVSYGIMAKKDSLKCQMKGNDYEKSKNSLSFSGTFDASFGACCLR
jgi:hypothetical protein